MGTRWATAATAAMMRRTGGTIAIPLAEIKEISFGGEGIGGTVKDDEDEDELNVSPCLNKYVKISSEAKTMEMEVSVYHDHKYIYSGSHVSHRLRCLLEQQNYS